MRISDWSSDVCSSDLTGSGGWKRASTPFPTSFTAFWAMSWNGPPPDGNVRQFRRPGQAQAADERDQRHAAGGRDAGAADHLHGHRAAAGGGRSGGPRSEEHTSELQSLMRSSYAVF